MTVPASVESQGFLFSRVPLGLLVLLPKAARRVYEPLHAYFLRWGKEIPLTTKELIKECGGTVGRRCIQKGLRQLEDLGLISRFRQAGGRIITFLASFVEKVKAQAKTGSQAGRKTPAAPAASQNYNPPPPPEAPLTPEQEAERRAELERWNRGQFGITNRPAISAAVPCIADPEKVREQEESRKRQLAAIKARKEPETPLGSDRAELPSLSDEDPPARE